MTLPLVSVILLNYNGAHYLPACLEALGAQTYPRERLEVIFSDNASTDNSVSLVQTGYPWVRILRSERNRGFTGGNNAAMRVARGDYLILLNNDTAPSPGWVEQMVAAAEADERVGVVTGHLQLFYNQVEIELRSETFTHLKRGVPAGVQVFAVESGAERGVPQYLDGFHGFEKDAQKRSFTWSQGQATLGAPAPLGGGPWTLSLKMSAARPDGSAARVSAWLDGELLAEWQVASGEPQEYRAAVPARSHALSRPVEQNTGSLVFRSGAGRDRGTYVRGDWVFYETDQGQYNRLEEVFAGCGASLLLRRKMLDEIGLLDDSFFIYYEDTDISWRARLRGWKVVYAPQAIVRHIHCGTMREWSFRFVYLTERNRLAMVFKDAAWRQVQRVWGGYLLRVARLTWRALFNLLRFNKAWRGFARELPLHAAVIATLLWRLPSLALKRRAIQSRRVVAHDQIQSWFVD
jgi:hypothetical protein